MVVLCSFAHARLPADMLTDKHSFLSEILKMIKFLQTCMFLRIFLANVLRNVIPVKKIHKYFC